MNYLYLILIFFIILNLTFILNFSKLSIFHYNIDKPDNLRKLHSKPTALAGGQIFTGDTPQLVRLRKVISEIADEIGADSVDQVIYQWILNMPSKPIIIIGSGKMARLESALNSQKLTLSREQWYRIWVASTGRNVP